MKLGIFIARRVGNGSRDSIYSLLPQTRVLLKDVPSVHVHHGKLVLLFPRSCVHRAAVPDIFPERTLCDESVGHPVRVEDWSSLLCKD